MTNNLAIQRVFLIKTIKKAKSNLNRQYKVLMNNTAMCSNDDLIKASAKIQLLSNQLENIILSKLD